MKVCVINNIYPPYDRGGAEQVVVKTVSGLLARGHDVVIITGSPESGVRVEHKGCLTIYRIPPSNLFFYNYAYRQSFFSRLVWHIIDIFNFLTAWRIKKILETTRPDVVHTHNLMGLSFLLPFVIRRLKFRHVHTVHDVQLVEPSGLILKSKERLFRYNGFPTLLYTWIMKKFMGSPDVVISPSQFLRTFYTFRGFFKNSIFEVIRNPVTFSVMISPKAETTFFRFMYVGQIEFHKGILILIEVFNRLHFENKPIELHIIGTGSLLEIVRELAKDNRRIKIYGRVERAALPALFHTADITVVPSLCYENSPTVIFESWSRGVPVLASNIEGIAELIKEGENGLTFKAGDGADLAAKMGWCVNHYDHILEMCKKTNQSLIGLSVEKYMERVEELYRGVAR